jgi:hypothetical protein
MSDSLGRAIVSGNVLGAIANPQQVNPLGAMDAGLRVAGNVYRLREAQAQQALGQAYQGAIDPDTGRFDPLKFNALVAGDPRTAMAAQSGVESSQKLQGEQFNLSAAQNGAINSALAGVLKLPDDQLAQGVVQQTQRLITAGVIPADRAHGVLLGLNGNDPAALRSQLETIWRGTLPTDQQREATYGQQGTYTAPGGNVAGYNIQTSGRGAGSVTTPPQPGAPQGISGADLDKPFDYLDANGAKQTTTYRQFLIDHGFTWAAQGGPGGAPGGLPSSLRNPAAQPPSGAQPQPGASTTPQPGPRPVQTAPSQADIEAQTGQARTSTDAFRAISNQAVASRSRSATLGTMLADAKQFTSGPLANVVGTVRNYANNLGLNINTEGLSAKESFNKLAAQLADAQGAGSDARMSVNIAANPHEGLSGPGIDLIVRQLQGNEDYLQARAALAAKYPDQKKINDFENEQGSKLDPRAFQFARMTVPQRQTYAKNLSDKDRTAVQQSYNWAVEHKLIGG